MIEASIPEFIPRLDRLRRLADYLETQVTDDHFDMRMWGKGCDPTRTGFCGCAAGHATAIFSRDGLILDNLYNFIYIKLKDMDWSHPHNSFTSLGYFFSIPIGDAEYLFCGPRRSRLEEVQIIREFITKMETTP